MIEWRQSRRFCRRRHIRRVLRGYREAQRGRPRRTLVGRERVGREGLRAEHWWTVAVTHGRTMQVILRMITLMETALTLVARWHTFHHAVAKCIGRRHPLFLLSSIAEPHPNHFLFELQRVRQRSNFLGRWFWLLVEMLLECTFYRYLNRRPLLSLSTLSGDLIDARRRAGRRIRLLEPLLQQRLQLAHIFKAQL